MKGNKFFLFESIIGFLIMISPWVLNFWVINIAAITNFVLGGIIFIVNLWIVFNRENKITFEPDKHFLDQKVEK